MLLGLGYCLSNTFSLYSSQTCHIFWAYLQYLLRYFLPFSFSINNLHKGHQSLVCCHFQSPFQSASYKKIEFTLIQSEEEICQNLHGFLLVFSVRATAFSIFLSKTALENSSRRIICSFKNAVESGNEKVIHVLCSQVFFI